MSLDNVDNEYYYYEGELLTKNSKLHAVVAESLTDYDCSCMSGCNDTNSIKNFRNEFLLEERLINDVPAEYCNNA